MAKNSGNSSKTATPPQLPKIPYETYAGMSKDERAAIPYGRRPYRLTPDEIEDLRQDAKEAQKVIEAEFADLFK